MCWTEDLVFLGAAFCMVAGYEQRKLPTTKYVLNSEFNDNMPSTGSGMNPDMNGRTFIECSSACDRQSGCVSFFFSSAASRCQLHSEVLGSSPSTVAISARYFALKGGPVVTTPFSLGPCPTLTSGPITIGLSDGSQFTFTVNPDVMVSQTSAASNCETAGYKLVRIQSQARLDAMMFIATCPDFAGLTLWINSRSDYAADPMDPDTWRTADGGLSYFGGLFVPSDPVVNFCVALRRDRFGNVPCDTTYHELCEAVTA